MFYFIFVWMNVFSEMIDYFFIDKSTVHYKLF